MSKADKDLNIVRKAGKLFDCPRVLKTCFNAYNLSSLEYCSPEWMSSAESQLGLLNSNVRSAESLCDGEICCLGHREKYFLYKIYSREDHPANENTESFSCNS